MASTSGRRLPSQRNRAVDFLEANPFTEHYVPRESPVPQGPEPEVEPAVDYPRLDDVPTHNAHLNPTCVTPFIAGLAARYYVKLDIAGFEIPKGIDGEYERKFLNSDTYKRFVQKLLDVHYGPMPSILYDSSNVVRPTASGKRSRWAARYKKVKVRRETIQVGDVVIIARGNTNPRTTALPLPRNIKDQPDAQAGALFWFAKVLSIRREDHTFHGQWFEHGSQTMLEELAHPQELFLTNLCDDVKLSAIITKCPCRKWPPGVRPPPEVLQNCQFFYSLLYDHKSGSFMDIPGDNPVHADDNFVCSLCTSAEKEQNEEGFSRVFDKERMLEGFKNHHEAFHYGDSIMISSERGPCVIGQILGLPNGRWSGEFWVTVRLFGRVSEREDFQRAAGVGLYEDQRLFLSEEFMEVCSSEILGKCYILPELPERQLKTWVETSPHHFFLSHISNSLDNNNGQSPLNPWSPTQEFVLCGYCMEREQTRAGELEKFMNQFLAKPLQVFDPFAGVGAFALGMCTQEFMQFTHAIEMDTTAARTLKKNSPETVVYNQCSNRLLKIAAQALINKENSVVDEVQSLDPNDEDQLPPLPRPEQIDCIVSGFPCQPHSSMNMHVHVRDLQNELFLNTISWVDLMKPTYCVFENVKGFTNYRLLAQQASQHKVTGGIQLGGLKFICRALVSMGYQVRFGLLQAAWYGTPQSRVRFFLLAAKSGHQLPRFPNPTHEFPTNHTYPITFPIAGSIIAVNSKGGSAPMAGVTIEDAISDLKRWDWENPYKVYSRQETGPEPPERQRVPKIKCCPEKAWCGPSQNLYEHPPFTAFQAWCRKQPATSLQHITPCFDETTIERAVNITLGSNADYLSLHTNSKPKLLDQFQMMDPTSANARLGFKSGMYGRLGGDDFFRTIVTNVRPTAKQSWVMNPWCRRILSVRELARAQGFPDNIEFVPSEDKPNINTMHRGIGNAVPWQVAGALSREVMMAKFEENKSTTLNNLLDMHHQDWLNVHKIARMNL